MMLIVIIFLAIVAVVAVAIIITNIVSVIRGEIMVRKIPIYRENKDGTLTLIERRKRR